MEFFILIYANHIAGYGEMFVRICLSAIVGIIIGLERSFKSKPAGVKNKGFQSLLSSVLCEKVVNQQM